LLPFLETKTVILEGRPAGYEDIVRSRGISPLMTPHTG